MTYWTEEEIRKMEETKKPRVLSLGKLDIEPYAGFFKGVGFGIVLGEGVYWKSVRFEITIPLFCCGVEFIWNNPVPQD